MRFPLIAGGAAVFLAASALLAYLAGRERNLAEARAFEAGRKACELAAANAVLETQRRLDAELVAQSIRAARRQAETEDKLATIRAKAALAARRDHVCLSPELVRLRNDARALRNALVADPAGRTDGSVPAASRDGI